MEMGSYVSPGCVNRRASTVSLGMRRLPITRIESIVVGDWARAAPAAISNAIRTANRHSRPPAHQAWDIKVSLIFTGLEPCGEHKYWCVPKFGFTGRISTPSLLEKIGSCDEERLVILDRSHHSQTVGRPRRPWDRIFPSVSVPRTGPLDRGLSPSLPEPDGFSPARLRFFLNCIPFRRSAHSHGILIRRGFNSCPNRIRRFMVSRRGCSTVATSRCAPLRAKSCWS